LSSLLPDATQIYNFAGEGLKEDPQFRGRIKTLPELFKDAGFHTMGGGKVFHLGHHDPQSFNENFFDNVEQNNDCNRDKQATLIRTRSGRQVSQACRTTAPVDSLLDFRVANAASAALERTVMQLKEPFFMVAGFYKPHTPYHVHSRFWNQFILYGTPDAERTEGPQQRQSFTNPELTFNMDSDILEDWGLDPWQSKDADFRRVMRTGYLAALAQVDEAMGRILLKLEELKLDKTTLVALVSDHGYFLGENNLFAKHNNYELALRVPTFFHVPWLRSPSSPILFGDEDDDDDDDDLSSRETTSEDRKSVKTQTTTNSKKTKKSKKKAKPKPSKSKPSLPMTPPTVDREWADYIVPHTKRSQGFFELVDLFPTVAGLMGLPMRHAHNGTDQSKLVISTMLRGHSIDLTPPRTEALSQVNRCSLGECSRTPNRFLYAAGYTVRTDKWRYTVFVHAPGGVPLWNTSLITQELYSHVKDKETLFAYEQGTSYDTEAVNVASLNPKTCAELRRQIQARFGGIADV